MKEKSVESKLAKITGDAVLSLCLFFFFIFGAGISGFGFREPDTCFLLAVGRWIVENGTIPATDPFTYTYAIAPNGGPFVPYQWLAEVISYWVVTALGAAWLLALAAVICSLAFAVVPLITLRLTNNYSVLNLFIIFVASLSLWCHAFVRPEMFSYLLLAIELLILRTALLPGANQAKPNQNPNQQNPNQQNPNQQNPNQQNIDWRAITVLVALAIFWANVHTGFVVGALVLAVACLADLIEARREKRSMNRQLCVAFLCFVLATLVTPFGVNLWRYLPHLYLTPLNKTIIELRPLGVAELSNVLFYPFFILLIFFALAVWRSWKGQAKMSSVDFSICLAAIVSAFCCARAVPFTSLIVSASLAPSFSAVRLGTGSFLAGVDERLRLIIDRTYPYWSMVVALISMIGALWMTSVIAPQLPQPSTAFKPPFAAAQFLESKAPPGNLLNDPHFGDVMMWTMRNCPKTFLDSRYDMFAFSLIQEYWRMVLCKEDWRELMDKYKIAWVFLPPNLPLVKALKDDGWLVTYEDEAAVVMRKPL